MTSPQRTPISDPVQRISADGLQKAFCGRITCRRIFLFDITHKQNHNHPSNGWYAQGLKAQYYRPAAQAAGFRILKPIALATFAALER
ncbi:MAG: hypothetical protein IJC98_03340, partial [Clostridia bacterium]|nr:hypothetical protein [Clostridia bacterium]